MTNYGLYYINYYTKPELPLDQILDVSPADSNTIGLKKEIADLVYAIYNSVPEKITIVEDAIARPCH